MLHHSVSLWNLAFYALMVFMATLGLWDVFFGFEENKCSMSYMFEYPEYQVRFCPPSLAAPRLGPLQPYPSVRFPCLGSPRLSLPRRPTASLLPPPRNTSQPPAVPFSCPFCPLFSAGSVIDGSRSILSPAPHVAPGSSPGSRPRIPSGEGPGPTPLIPGEAAAARSFPPIPPPSLPALTGAPALLCFPHAEILPFPPRSLRVSSCFLEGDQASTEHMLPR